MSKVNVTYIETASDRLMTALEEQEAFDAMKKAEDEQVIRDADTLGLVRALYDRGTTIKQIFGLYYEFEEAGNARTMDVEDAQLAGHDGKGEVEGADF